MSIEERANELEDLVACYCQTVSQEEDDRIHKDNIKVLTDALEAERKRGRLEALERCIDMLGGVYETHASARRRWMEALRDRVEEGKVQEDDFN